MIRISRCALLLAAVSMPATAANWVHAKSKIALPDEIGDMRRGQERDVSGGRGVDVMVQYGSETEPVTVYVYRGSYPNPALWFERTRHAMKINVGSPTERVAPRSFRFAGASEPNGLREEIPLPQGGVWKTTAVAIAQTGEWVVKARMTSQTLDVTGIAAKMDRLLAGFQVPSGPGKTLPLIVPGPCDQDGTGAAGRPLRDRTDEATAAAMLAGTAALAEARGFSGLAAAPEKWCRTASEFPAEHASVYRERGTARWVALVGDAGMAVSGFDLAPTASGFATFSSNPTSVRVVALYDGPADRDQAILDALPVLAGQQPGLIEISMEPDG
jgi:hypothetical protein